MILPDDAIQETVVLVKQITKLVKEIDDNKYVQGVPNWITLTYLVCPGYLPEQVCCLVSFDRQMKEVLLLIFLYKI
ncbi:hypothetical protein LIT32_08720 [Bacillus sp. CMF21]|uniref:hypothetical protein n=1 Tax=Metabacillus dongyingensis TaxID=2874282 RepID=UPI001CBF6B9A|nr:hypothetical protein [Metabacillus dongyingensis]UAL53856.1 hypothetical protein K8L98_08825 [Metabacillus dongyingensis]UOK59266.1 hypothetical protein MGI18_10340 [Bacillus sp. OVS6]USK30167.1 hypothetical protein LIT32_08720 [Bacillus sp. CMF21]